MSMIKIEDLTFSYPDSSDLIFDHCSFLLDTDWKLGCIGRNGKGKTTLLNLLLGTYDYQGKITASVKFDYFPYLVENTDRLTGEVLHEIAPQAEDWEFLREFSRLSVEDEVFWRPFSLLSKGEQTKVMLAAFFLNRGFFHLIDEPTNHLDEEGRKLVSAYLNRQKGFILVSHDRSFLDGCTDHIISLNRMDIEVQSGNFSSWMTNFMRQQNFEETQNKKLKKDIQKLRQAADRTASWSADAEKSKFGNGPVDRGFIGHKSAKMMKRAKNIQARHLQAMEEKSSLLKNVEKTEDLKIFPQVYHSRTLAVLDRVSLFYDGRRVCGPVSFKITTGDYIALSGKNGSGKSSLLKLLTGEKIAHTGTLSISSGVEISYVPQDASFLHGSLSEFSKDSGIDETLFKSVLRKLGMEREQFSKFMQDFSAGQKKKVLLAKSLCEKAHVYVWDEPLNYLDIDSRMQLEKLLQEYQVTMVLVEHDRTFLNTVATDVIVL